jgi:hypothetical protein
MKDDYDLFEDKEGRVPGWLTFLLSSIMALLAYSLIVSVLYLIWKAIFND